MSWLPIIGVAVSAVVCIGAGMFVAVFFFDTPSTDRPGESGEQPPTRDLAVRPASGDDFAATERIPPQAGDGGGGVTARRMG